MARRAHAALVCLLALGACTTSTDRGVGAGTPLAGLPPPSTDTTAPGGTAAGTPSAAAAPRFRASISRVPMAKIARSWRRGCPVPPHRLRLIRLTHRGTDTEVHEGELVAHRDVAHDLVRAFRAMWDAGFPVERVELVDRYGADDDRSMAANNTSAFNCRRATGSRTRWSQHAYGRAIDINPVQNPWVDGRDIRPPAGRAYVDRRDVRPGMIVRGDRVVRAFRAIGWGWGGDFRSVKDYQHFSSSGR